MRGIERVAGKERKLILRATICSIDPPHTWLSPRDCRAGALCAATTTGENTNKIKVHMWRIEY